MKVQIAKWGNSAAVRLPKTVLDELGLAPGAELDLSVEGRSMLLRAPRKTLSLDEIVAEMKRLGGPDYDYGQRDWPDADADWPAEDRPDEDPTGT